MPPDSPAPTAPLSAEARLAHADATSRDEDGYADPDSGLFVMTASALARQGRCCAKGCRHCPYAPPWVGETALGVRPLSGHPNERSDP